MKSLHAGISDVLKFISFGKYIEQGKLPSIEDGYLLYGPVKNV